MTVEDIKTHYGFYLYGQPDDLGLFNPYYYMSLPHEIIADRYGEYFHSLSMDDKMAIFRAVDLEIDNWKRSVSCRVEM